MLKVIRIVFGLLIVCTAIQNFSQEKTTVFLASGFAMRSQELFLDRYENFFTPDHLVKCLFFSDAKDSLSSCNRILDSFYFSLTKKTFCRESYWGYQADIDTIFQFENNKNIQNKPLILFGYCRGAVACINFMSIHNPLSVSAMILDSPYSNVLEVARSYIAPFGLASPWNEILWKFVFPNYSKASLPVVDQILNIKNKELPILLLHSKDDEFVPFIESLYLYKKFKDVGFKYVYIVPLKGSHWKKQQKDDLSLHAIHSFYKEYGFPYNSEYAIKNIDEFCCDEEAIEVEIKKHLKKIEHQLLIAQNKLKMFLKIS